MVEKTTNVTLEESYFCKEQCVYRGSPSSAFIKYLSSIVFAKSSRRIFDKSTIRSPSSTFIKYPSTTFPKNNRTKIFDKSTRRTPSSTFIKYPSIAFPKNNRTT